MQILEHIYSLTENWIFCQQLLFLPVMKTIYNDNEYQRQYLCKCSLKGLKIAEKRHMLKIHVPVCKQGNGTYYLNLFSDKVDCFKYIHIFQVLW